MFTHSLEPLLSVAASTLDFSWPSQKVAPQDFYLTGSHLDFPYDFLGPPTGSLWRASPPSADYVITTHDYFPMHDKKCEKIINQIVQPSYWAQIPPKDISEFGRPYRQFYYRNDATTGIVAAQIGGEVDIPLDVVAQVVFEQEDQLEGREPVKILAKIIPNVFYDQQIGADSVVYYQVLNAKLVWVHFVTRIYRKQINPTTVVIWSEMVPIDSTPLSDSSLLAQSRKAKGFRPFLPLMEPKQVCSAYILEKVSDQKTKVSLVTNIEFGGIGLMNAVANNPDILEQGGKDGFVNYHRIIREAQKSRQEKSK